MHRQVSFPLLGIDRKTETPYPAGRARNRAEGLTDPTQTQEVGHLADKFDAISSLRLSAALFAAEAGAGQ